MGPHPEGDTPLTVTLRITPDYQPEVGGVLEQVCISPQSPSVSPKLPFNLHSISP